MRFWVLGAWFEEPHTSPIGRKALGKWRWARISSTNPALRTQNRNLLVASRRKLDFGEFERFFVQNRVVAVVPFPRRDISEFVVVALGFAVFGLVFGAEMAAATFFAVQRVGGQKSATREACSKLGLRLLASPGTRTFSQNSSRSARISPIALPRLSRVRAIPTLSHMMCPKSR